MTVFLALFETGRESLREEWDASVRFFLEVCGIKNLRRSRIVSGLTDLSGGFQLFELIELR
jgi:hypothetical protein